MEGIFKESTLKTPEINFDPDKGLLELTGRSTPENIDTVYMPLINWLKEYIKKPQDNTTFNFKFEYFNSSTAKAVVQMLQVLKDLYESEKTVEINWYYYDEDLLEYGVDFQEVLGMNFNCIQI
jgi:hypothetical protein